MITAPVNVGWDFDEPIFPWYDLAHQASLKAGIALPEHEPTSWAPHTTYGCTLEEWVAVLDNEIEHGDMYHQPFKPDAVEAVKRLHVRGYENHIITARGQFGEMGELVKKITKSEIIRQGLPYSSLTFNKDKVPVALALNLHYMLDDAPHNFWPLLDAGVNVFLLDERWNRDGDDAIITPYVKGKWPKPRDPEGRRVFSAMEYANLVMDQQGLTGELTIRQKAHVQASMLSS